MIGVRLLNRFVAKGCVDIFHIVSACLIYGVVIYPHYLLWQFIAGFGYEKLLVIMIPAFFYTFLLGLTIILSFFRLFLPPLKQGVYGIKDKKAFMTFISHHYLHLFMEIPYRSLLHRTALLCYLFYRGMGMKLSLTTRISPTCTFRGLSLITIDEGTVIGGMAGITSLYSLSQDSLHFREVKIGKNVMIGGGSAILPGVEIGDDVLLLADSTVMPGTKIPAGEVWGGRPAKRIGTKSLFIAIASELRR